MYSKEYMLQNQYNSSDYSNHPHKNRLIIYIRVQWLFEIEDTGIQNMYIVYRETLNENDHDVVYSEEYMLKNQCTAIAN